MRAGQIILLKYLSVLKYFAKLPYPEAHNKLEELKELSLCDPDHLPPGKLKDADWHGQQCKLF